MPAHFRQYISAGVKSPGVILLREGTSIAAAIEELVLIWSASEAEEWINRLLWIPLRAKHRGIPGSEMRWNLWTDGTIHRFIMSLLCLGPSESEKNNLYCVPFDPIPPDD